MWRLRLFGFVNTAAHSGHTTEVVAPVLAGDEVPLVLDIVKLEGEMGL
jgi:hypothetical protein